MAVEAGNIEVCCECVLPLEIMKPTYYKLTDHNGQTRGPTQWGENITHKAVGSSDRLCTESWIHFYRDPILAVLVNPIHARFSNPRLWEGFVPEGEELHEPLKSGSRIFTTTREITLPRITRTQRTIFGILCAKVMYHDPAWNTWADNYISGKDRSIASAAVHAAASAAAAVHAADAAAVHAASAAAAAADAAAADAAAAAYAAAYAAAHAAAAEDTNFIELAHKALTYD